MDHTEFLLLEHQYEAIIDTQLEESMAKVVRDYVLAIKAEKWLGSHQCIRQYIYMHTCAQNEWRFLLMADLTAHMMSSFIPEDIKRIVLIYRYKRNIMPNLFEYEFAGVDII